MSQTVICPSCHGYVHVADAPPAPDQTVWRTFLFLMLLVNLLGVLYVARFVYTVSHPFG